MTIHNHRILNSLDGSSGKQTFSLPITLSILLGSILLGVIAGYVVSRTTPTTTTATTNTTGSTQTDSGAKKSAGIPDAKTFPDKAEGALKEGGIEDEGTHHLERSGGASQNVYLTSSTVDLSEFVGKKVRVWGQTNTAKTAGWLMDVGYVEVL